MEYFLKITSWQLFLILYGIPVGLLFALPRDVVMPESTPTNELLTYCAFLIFVGLYFLWLWSIGEVLRRRTLNSNEIKGFGFYKFGFIVFAAYFIIMGYVLVKYSSKTVSPAWVLPVLACLHIAATVCIFQIAAFNARILKFAENQSVKSTDWVGDMFLFVMYPVGLWILQPRINKVFRQQNNP